MHIAVECEKDAVRAEIATCAELLPRGTRIGCLGSLGYETNPHYVSVIALLVFSISLAWDLAYGHASDCSERWREGRKCKQLNKVFWSYAFWLFISRTRSDGVGPSCLSRCTKFSNFANSRRKMSSVASPGSSSEVKQRRSNSGAGGGLVHGGSPFAASVGGPAPSKYSKMNILPLRELGWLLDVEPYACCAEHPIQF